MRELQIYVESLGFDGKNPVLWIPSDANDFVLRWQLSDMDQVAQFGGNWLQQVQDKLLRLDPSDRHNKLPSTVEDEATIVFSGETADKPRLMKARILLSTTAKQRQVSASIRFSGIHKTPPHKTCPPLEWHRAFRVLVERARVEGDVWKQVARDRSKFLFSPDAVCDVVLDAVQILQKDNQVADLGFEAFSADVPPNPNSIPQIDEHPSGVIVVAGGTGTGKSTYARGLALRFLLRLAMVRLSRLQVASKLSEYDPPHLVTFEDPVEAWSLDFANTLPGDDNSIDLQSESQSDLKCGLRLTCRAKRFDVDCLKSACMHALRQKPNVVYIGECREPKDWNMALELGGTGHLVVTTCHSSSLVDTFVKLSRPGSSDAQSRQNLATSLLGVLHLKSGSLRSHDGVQADPQEMLRKFAANQTFFSLWRKTPESISNFVVDGLASLVIDEENILSRTEMTRRILDYQKRDSGEILESHATTREVFFETLKQYAMKASFRIDLELT